MAMGKRVLVTSYTHSAVDNILLKLVGGSAHRHGSYTTDVVRVGRKHSVHPALHRYLTSDLASEMDHWHQMEIRTQIKIRLLQICIKSFLLQRL